MQDGLTLTDCLDKAQTTERFELLAFAIVPYKVNGLEDGGDGTGPAPW
jgi:hypothetical protein